MGGGDSLARRSAYGLGTSPQAVAFSPNGSILAVAGGGKIYFRNLATAKTTAIQVPAKNWGGIAFSPDRKSFAAYSYLGAEIYLYSIKYPTP